MTDLASFDRFIESLRAKPSDSVGEVPERPERRTFQRTSNVPPQPVEIKGVGTSGTSGTSKQDIYEKFPHHHQSEVPNHDTGRPRGVLYKLRSDVPDVPESSNAAVFALRDVPGDVPDDAPDVPESS